MDSVDVTPLPAGHHDLLTTGECADLLRVSVQTLERWRALGGPDYPPFHKNPGRRGKVTYSRAAVLAWHSQRQFSSTSDRGA